MRPFASRVRGAQRPFARPSLAPSRPRPVRVRAESNKNGENADESGKLDIDALASRLSKEADKMRQSLSGSIDGDFMDSLANDEESGDIPDVPSSPAELFNMAAGGISDRQGSTSTSGPKGVIEGEGRLQDAAPLKALGMLDRVIPQDLELYQILGKISVLKEFEIEDPSALSRKRRETEGPKRTAVIAYLGRYLSGQPFEGPVTVLIKEYIQGSRAVAVNELRLLQELTGPVSEPVWKIASQESKDGPPVVRALGCFIADASEQALESLQELNVDQYDNSPVDSLWVVYQWTNMRPATGYPSYRQPEPIRWFGGEQKAGQQRRFFLKCLMAGTLDSLRFCHERGIVHGSIGSSCMMMNTYADREGESLVVKLDGLGFGRNIQGPALTPQGIPATKGLKMEDSSLALALYEDRKAVAVALLEVIFGALVSPDSIITEGESNAALVQRLLVDVFKGNVNDFKDYCEADSHFEAVCTFMGNDGWSCLADLLDIEVPLSAVLSSKFLETVKTK